MMTHFLQKLIQSFLVISCVR